MPTEVPVVPTGTMLGNSILDKRSNQCTTLALPFLCWQLSNCPTLLWHSVQATLNSRSKKIAKKKPRPFPKDPHTCLLQALQLSAHKHKCLPEIWMEKWVGRLGEKELYRHRRGDRLLRKLINILKPERCERTPCCPSRSLAVRSTAGGAHSLIQSHPPRSPLQKALRETVTDERGWRREGDRQRSRKRKHGFMKQAPHLAFSDFFFSPPISTPGTIQVKG